MPISYDVADFGEEGHHSLVISCRGDEMFFLESDINLAKSLAAWVARDDWAAASRLLSQLLEGERPSLILSRMDALGLWYGFRLAVNDGVLTVFCSKIIDDPNLREGLLLRLVLSFPLIARFVATSGDTHGEVDLNLTDAPNQPGLAFCGARPDAALVPDPVFLGARGYNTVRHHFEASPIHWLERKPIAFWRGSTTGVPTDSRLGWRSLPRIELCELGRRFPELFDLGITQIADIADDPSVVQAYLEERGFFRPYVPMQELHKFRYQIDIDGHANS